MSLTLVKNQAGEQLGCPVDDVLPECWCGQDLIHVRFGHCPRCGRATVTRSRLGPVTPAA